MRKKFETQGRKAALVADNQASKGNPELPISKRVRLPDGTIVLVGKMSAPGGLIDFTAVLEPSTTEKRRPAKLPDEEQFAALKNKSFPTRKDGQTLEEYIAEHCPNARIIKDSSTSFIIPTDAPLAKPRDKADRSTD